MTRKRIRIGLLVDYVISDYTQLILVGIKKACLEQDVELLIFPIAAMHNIKYGYDYQYIAVTAFLSLNNLDGIIFCSGTQMHYMSKADLVSYLKSYSSIPIINISAEIPGFPSILVECYTAYEKLIGNLVNVQGCSKFGILGVRGNSGEAKLRTKYIKTILEKNGIPVRNLPVWKGNFDYQTSLTELETYYEAHKSFDFDALICLNDEMAFGAMQFCQKIGKRVPEDVAIVGFDDLDRSAFCVPPLTSINQQLDKQGKVAVEILVDLIRGKKVENVTVVEAKPIMRESSARKSYDEIESDHHTASNYSGMEWHMKKQHIFQVTKFFTEMQSDMTIEQLRSRINKDMRSFKVSACAVVLYDKPIEMNTPFDYFNLPHKASVFSCFDDHTGFDSTVNKDKYKFDPNEYMLPPDLIEFSTEGEIVMTLFHNNLQYGYIILRPGDYDVTMYDLLIKMMSATIANVYSFSLMHSESTKFRAQYDKLDVIARTDELTGLNNRRGLYDLGQITLKFAKAMQQSGVVVYCDMDGLKKINDNYGHEVGDRAIIAESIILKGNFRSNDIVARIGGDEFAIICPGLNQQVFERIRNQINDDCVKWSEANKTPYKLAISMGAVTYPSEESDYQITPLLSKADAALYVEKCRRKKLNK